MSAIFISRILNYDSIFLQILQSKGYEVINISLIEFSFLPFYEIPSTDWIFFYSKTAAHFFFQHLQKSGLQTKAKLAALGPATASAIEKQGFHLDFTGTGEPQTTAQAFAKLAAGQRVLFPRAENSRQSIQQLLENQIIAIDLILYKNQMRTDFELPECQWLVFTSPLNAQAYFQKYPLKLEQKILAIGETTAQTLRQLGVSEILIAENPSEEALANAIVSA
ncbi:MAG: uroporphyrinogen-III synthase [Saprospiraceae bacterium]|nr:uroporphyrinogen-III synthase [Saprospiraceae bacterium]